MAEYIEREAVIKKLDHFQSHLHTVEGTTTIGVAKTLIAEIPVTNVRPVVMCRDCKWTKTDGMEDPAIYCEKWDRWEMPPDGFCWLGKKRKETNNGN